MKSILKLLLSFIIFFGAVPAVQAVPAQSYETCEMACADEDIKKKKKKKKKIGGKGKKQRMAGGMDPRLLMMSMPMVNPNTQMMAGMGIADPNRHQVPSFLQDYVKY